MTPVRRLGAHDSVVDEYLRGIDFAEMSANDAQRKHQILGVVVARELEAFEGESFLVEDGDGQTVGVALVGPVGLVIVSLEDGERGVSVRTFGQLTDPVTVRTTGLEDGDPMPPYRLTIHHALLPTGRIVYQARNKAALERADRALGGAFGHLLDIDS
jgi:hypothetical protein